MTHNLLASLQTFEPTPGREGRFFSLPQLEGEGVGPVSRLPVCVRIILESLLRNCDGRRVTEDDVRAYANWQPRGERTMEVPFVVARILLQDFTGVPLLVDLAAMRSAVRGLGRDPKIIKPLVPVDLVIDHSVQIDYWNRPDAPRLNMEMEFRRNRQRYRFPLTLRVDTPVEAEYYRHGGILQYVLRQLLAGGEGQAAASGGAAMTAT